jgi:DNA replication protein DnaC
MPRNEPHKEDQKMSETWQEKFLRLRLHHPDLKKAADEVQFFCRDWIFGANTDRVLLILVGNSGCGKTHLLKAVEHFARGAATLAHQKRSQTNGDWINKIPSVQYMFWPTISTELARKQDWPITDAVASDLLLWDDLGAETDPWKLCADAACQILSRRGRKFTLVTTNIAADRWGDRFDKRIEDRLLRTSVVVDLTAVPSYATI